MKVMIEFSTANDALQAPEGGLNREELVRLLESSADKIDRLRACQDDCGRDPQVHHEDVLLDLNGNVVGKIQIDTSFPKVVIEQDPDPRNPREDFDTVGTMVCWHRRLELGDQQVLAQGYQGSELGAKIKLPLYLLDHSGLSISTKPFSCPWDSGQVGWIYATDENIRRAFGEDPGEEMVQRILIGEVKLYNQYLQGSVWLCTVQHEDGGEDCCGGFYGDDLQETGILENYCPDLRGKIEEAWNKKFDR